MHPGIDHILLLCLAAFAAGFVDAIVGGGGLIQTPATIVLLQGAPVVNALGTTKLPSFSGTLLATSQYLKRVKLDPKLTALMCTIAFFAAYAGSELLTIVSNGFMKPVLLVVLVLMAIYTYSKKDFGQRAADVKTKDRLALKGAGIALVCGFYDGFIGPGTGSLLIMAFISFLGYDFLKASAQAKTVNLSTNLGSIILFTLKGKIIWVATIPMAFCNALGGFIGARLAISKGNRFIRAFFLAVVILTLLRFAYDVFHS